MASRRKLLSASTGLFHRFTSARPQVPVISQIPVQKAGIFASRVQQFSDFHHDGHPQYEKWIVVMDFPRPISDKDMENTFVEIAATVFKSSLEEAKQKIYKMETKMYWGFHIHASEEMARKFVEISGVVQVLPHSSNNRQVEGVMVCAAFVVEMKGIKKALNDTIHAIEIVLYLCLCFRTVYVSCVLNLSGFKL